MRQGIRQEVLKIYIPEHLAEAIIKKVHESQYNEHMAAEKNFSEIRSSVPYKKRNINYSKKKLQEIVSFLHYIAEERKHQCH